MSFLKSLFGKNEDDSLFDKFVKANQQMNAPEAQSSLKKMSDEGLMKAALKVDELAKKNPGFMLLNTLLFAEFADRPHLKNPFN
jgi:hypothetical protein